MRNKPKVDIAYPNYPLTLEEGEVSLTDAIRQFHGSIVQARTPSKASNPRLPSNIAIKAAAGLGKTTKVISELCVGQMRFKQAVHVEYYVPTHNLSEQLVQDLEQAYNTAIERIITESEKPKVSINVIKGRLQTDKTGQTLCMKPEQVQELVNLGYPISSRLCKNETAKCEHFNDCVYQKQFKQQEIDTDKLTLPAVTVMTHHQLFLERHNFLPKPDFVVIDESFYQAGIEIIEIQDEILALITSAHSEPSNTLKALRAFILDGKPLLKCFRQLNVTKQDLLKEADKYRFKEITDIRPDQTATEQSERLKSSSKYIKFDYILTALADELDSQDRDQSYLLNLDTSRGIKLIFMRRKEMNLPSDVPVLFIDADLNEEVINLFRPDTMVIHIPVERLATVHQFNKTLSQYSRQNHPELTNQIHTFLDLFKDNEKTLIITTKSLRKALTNETDTEVLKTGKYGKSAINHYSNLRGLNQFKEFENVVILDRNQPNNEQLEQSAKALWFDTGMSIITCNDSGEKTYPRKLFGLRMKDQSEQNIEASYHPDKQVNILLEINRNAEITQAIDRLRLLRGDNRNRQVFIATAIPVDIRVDYYWDWNLLHRLLRLMEQSHVVPLHPEHFLRVFSEDTVKTKSGAKDLIKNLNRMLPLIKILIKNYILFEYKHTESRKSARALVSTSCSNPIEAIEMNIGITVLSANNLTH